MAARRVTKKQSDRASDELRPDSPDLSVVLINWRMGKDLASVLPSIRRQESRISREIIVVNKPSEDGTEELCAEYPEVRLITHEIFGIAEMRNVGIEAARGRYCLMLDADTEILPGCFDALVEFMDRYARLGACGGHTRRPDGSIEYNVKRFYSLATIAVRRSPVGVLWPNNPWNRQHLMLDRDHDRPFLGDWVAGACFCMRREAIEEVGLFDDRYYFGFEDVDWCWRAKRLGWKIAFCPSARIIHKVQQLSRAGFNRFTFAHLKSGILFWLKMKRLDWGLTDDSPRLTTAPGESTS
ncbi:glycosyltransferase family 2 protein [bacterium]|nr:glycosyltransferase family 2 protein [bacterium]